MSSGNGPFTLTVAAGGYYLAGFPMLVAVDVRNVSTNVLQRLRPFGLFSSPSPVSFELRGGGRTWTWEEKPPALDGEPDGEGFAPGQAWAALQDLSELHPDIPAGHYELTATILFSGRAAHSPPVRVEVKAPSKDDAAIAARLKSSNDAKKPSWNAFLRRNWSTPDGSRLSPAGRMQLDYHLYVHRAAYGPTPVAALDPEGPWRFGHGVLEAEAAVLRLEILHAAKRPEVAGVRAAVLERWPGLAWRVERITQERGFLTSLRVDHGADRGGAPTDQPRPYASPP